MARHKHYPPAPKERPISLAASGSPYIAPRAPRPERLPVLPTFDPAHRVSRTTTSGQSDMIGLIVFTVLIVLGLLASARALLVM